jgi:flavin-dependent dehydrogenase
MSQGNARTLTSRADGDPVTVVGAGPAGLACAIVLARAGRRVIVRERRAGVGARFHGDFQGLENWSSEGDIVDALAADGIEPSFDCHPVRRGITFDAWGERYPVASKKPIYYLVRRGDMAGSIDRGLLEQARSLGVEVRFRDRVEAGELRGPAVLARGPRTADAIAMGYVFETGMADGHWICFDNRLAPLGYAYLLVHAGRGTVATVLYADFKRLPECLARSVEFFQQRAGLSMTGERRFTGFANFRLPNGATHNGHPVIGEEAGFQDWLAGFGLRYAFRSATLAARSLLGEGDYIRSWRAEFLPLLRVAASNRLGYAVFGDRGMRWMLRNILSPNDAREVLHRLYNPMAIHRLIYPLALWRYRMPLLARSKRRKP